MHKKTLVFLLVTFLFSFSSMAQFDDNKFGTRVQYGSLKCYFLDVNGDETDVKALSLDVEGKLISYDDALIPFFKTFGDYFTLRRADYSSFSDFYIFDENDKMVLEVKKATDISSFGVEGLNGEGQLIVEDDFFLSPFSCTYTDL